MSCSKQCFDKDDEYYEHEDCHTCPGRDDGTMGEKRQASPCSRASAGSTAPVWGARKCANGEYQILYPGNSDFYESIVQITAGVSRKTMETLLKEITEALS